MERTFGALRFSGEIEGTCLLMWNYVLTTQQNACVGTNFNPHGQCSSK